jgi:hypothetical protein
LGIMKILILLVAVSALAAQPVFAQSDLQRSHIEANVPPPEEFERLLQRDLLAFFKQSLGASVTSVEVQPLRSGPTQSGVSYPKFYLWVKVMAGSSVQQAGAVRVAAVQRTRFEVTDFMAAASIKAKPSEVGAVFPAALVSAIQARAAGE